MNAFRLLFMFFPYFKLLNYVHKIKSEHGIIYQTIESFHKKQLLKLDVYRLRDTNPEKNTAGLPIFLHIHGLLLINIII